MIKIHKITPQGYCNGVKRALAIVEEALQNPQTPKPVYLLGNIIHNRRVVEGLKERGVLVAEDKQKTRAELLDGISAGSVVFSAHGVSPAVYQKAKDKGLNIIDATCGNVLAVHKKIKTYLELGYECLYVGTKGHPECEGVLGISGKIRLISCAEDIGKLKLTADRIYATNQTTLSKFDIEDIFRTLKEVYPASIIDDKICDATTVRQRAMAEQEKVDLCIVVGDASSSNTKKLAAVSERAAGIKTVLCEDLASLDKSLLKNVNSVSVSSGASTPDTAVEEIIEYLRTL